MAGNNFDVCWHHLTPLLTVANDAAHATAAAYVYLRECAVKEMVAHVNDVGLFEPHHTVAVGVTIG